MLLLDSGKGGVFTTHCSVAWERLFFLRVSNEPCVDKIAAIRCELAYNRMAAVLDTYGECRDNRKLRSSAAICRHGSLRGKAMRGRKEGKTTGEAAPRKGRIYQTVGLKKQVPGETAPRAGHFSFFGGLLGACFGQTAPRKGRIYQIVGAKKQVRGQDSPPKRKN